MTAWNLSVLANAAISLGRINARVRDTFSFQYLPDLAGGTSVAQDDIVYYDCFDRRLYKGLVKRIKHSLNGESVEVTCQSADNFVNCQTWTPVRKWYNKLEQGCESYPTDATIADFIAAEFVGTVTTWFTTITVASSLATLRLPEISLERRGFLDALDAILAPYPYASWRIDYSGDPLFPIGALVIYDMNPAITSTHTIKIGGADGIATALEVEETTENCAASVLTFARGAFVERLELLAPNWTAEEEEIQVTDVYVEKPLDASGGIRLPNGHEFPQEIYLFVENADYHAPPGVGVVAGAFRLWHGADFKMNMETGDIQFLRPEEGADWWWVNRETGQVATTVSEVLLGNLLGSFWRRPVAFDDAHIGENVLYRISYKRIGERPYRAYKTLYPIADLRLFNVEALGFDPATDEYNGEAETVFRKAPSTFDIYIPKVAMERFTIDNRPDVNVNDIGFLDPPLSTMIAQYNTYFNEYNKLLGNIAETAPVDNSKIPSVRANMLWPVATGVEGILRWFSLAQSDASFEEGTPCVMLGRRQLVALPEWFDRPNGGSGTALDALNEADRPMRAGWATWSVMAHYTSWEERVITRTNILGVGRVARAVANSAFSYTNKNTVRLATDDEIVFDNTATYLEDMADMQQSFYGAADWTGTITVGLTLDPGTKKWIIPFKIGDYCALAGAINAKLASFKGIIRTLDLGQIDEGVLTLEFGRPEPKVNPFLPAPTIEVDIEGDNAVGPGAAGLEKLGD